MKDLMQLWGRLAGRTYSAVNTNSNNGNNFSDDFTEFARDSSEHKRGRSKRSEFFFYVN